MGYSVGLEVEVKLAEGNSANQLGPRDEAPKLRRHEVPLHMRDRYKVIGNAFHAGVMKHILKCCISDMAMSGVVTRDDVRRQEVPFTENKDHVEPGGLWAAFVQESHVEEALALQSTS